jgi:hypothetical protein
MKDRSPPEALPAIGTVENPAFFFDGSDLFLSYQTAPVAGGGVAVLQFSDVICFEMNPANVHGLAAYPYPISPWNFTEVLDSDRTTRWRVLTPRFWTISFNDVAVEVVFSDVEKVYEASSDCPPAAALLACLKARIKTG